MRVWRTSSSFPVYSQTAEPRRTCNPSASLLHRGRGRRARRDDIVATEESGRGTGGDHARIGLVGIGALGAHVASLFHTGHLEPAHVDNAFQPLDPIKEV